MAGTRHGRSARRGMSVMVLAGLAGFVASTSSATAQTPGAAKPVESSGASTPSVATSPRATLQKMSRMASLEVTDKRLEDVLDFISGYTGADIEPAWRSENADGLDKDKLITLNAKNIPALDLLERVLVKAQTEFQQNTWQLSDTGVLEVGPKDRLNKHKRLVIYDINDLLAETPNFYEVPRIDLQAVLQQAGRGGSGGGQSPIRDDQPQQVNRQEMEKAKQDRIDAVKGIITSLVEPEQWQDNGGDGATIRYFQGTLIVNAPDYMHRQINGYPFWPAHATPGGADRR